MKTITHKMAQTATGKWYIVSDRGDIATILRNSNMIHDSTPPELVEEIIDFCFNQGEDPAEIARNLCGFLLRNQLREFELKRVLPHAPK